MELVANQYEAFGKYVLLEKLATGGMAEVFLARGSGAGGIGKFFAIKRILPQFADSPEFIEMFKDEAKIAINLSHSNIVSIHEFGVERGQFFLVMDYVEGRNLRQVLNKMKKSSVDFTTEQIVYMIKEVAAGLDHAHRCIDGGTGKPLNITHRDMSPQNVMLSFEGETKIVDFGIAKAESQIENTRAGTLKGKFGYMSPEQAEGQPVDLRTDIFSLGIVLWELLANDRLFVANNEINTLRKIRDCQIPSLRKINPNLHTELERIVQKALARDRNLRYQTGAALQRDLNRFLNRQYPDFSSADFSVFIKSLFADEILALRKRLVEYTKINVELENTAARANRDAQEQGHAESQILMTRSQVTAADDDDDNTSLLDTNTNSFVGQDLVTGSSLGGGPNTLSLHGGEDDQNLEVSGVSKVPAHAGGILDDDMLANVNLPNEPTHVSQVRRLRANTETRPARTISRRPHVAGAPEAQPPSSFVATLIIFTAVCVGIFTSLVKYFPATMQPVIAATMPYAGAYYCALGAVPCGGDQRDPASRTPHAATAPAAVGAGARPNLEADPIGLTVSSNPSGAEIILNGRSTGMVTPSRIEVPPQATFTIGVRKRGYSDFQMTEVTRESLGRRFDATLTKLNVGYVDVEFFPPQDAILYVNGRQVATERAAARDVMVRGDVPVKLRAESRTSNTYDETTVTIGVDQKKLVRLNPRKLSRAPTNSP